MRCCHLEGLDGSFFFRGAGVAPGFVDAGLFPDGAAATVPMTPIAIAAAVTDVNVRFNEKPFCRELVRPIASILHGGRPVLLHFERTALCGSNTTAGMSSTLTAAALQTSAHERESLNDAWPRVAARVRDAASNGAQLVVLPEGTLPAYVLGYAPFAPSEIAAAVDECRAIAHECGIVLVVGAARSDGNRLFNSALVIDADGSVAGVADKHFLWHFDRQWFGAGERLQPISTSLGVVGALICADGRIPTIASALVDRGAQILVMPTAWVTSGRDPDNLENVQADLLAQVRAKENGVPFVAANKCGVERRCVAYCGKSQIVSADGTVAAIAGQHNEATIFAQVTMGAARPFRSTQAPPNATRERISGRVAITAREPGTGDEELLRIMQAQTLVSRAGVSDAQGQRLEIPVVNDESLFDPGFLTGPRVDGLEFAVWRTRCEPVWQTRFARTRAVELKMYLAVIDERRERAYAVDPDGTVICGTFDGYSVASFGYEPWRTAQTLVAPGTDVLEGLQRANVDAGK